FIRILSSCFFFFNVSPPTLFYTLSLHDALPILHQTSTKNLAKAEFMMALGFAIARSTNIDAHLHVQGMLAELIEHVEFVRACIRDRKSTRLNSSHLGISYAVFCLKKKKKNKKKK